MGGRQAFRARVRQRMRIFPLQEGDQLFPDFTAPPY
jgi:hypothetical protein